MQLIQGILLYTNRFVEHATSPILVFPVGAVYETVAEDVVVYTSIPSHRVRGWAREPLHTIFRVRAFCNTGQELVTCT
jgi:hypothetical protein